MRAVWQCSIEGQLSPWLIGVPVAPDSPASGETGPAAEPSLLGEAAAVAIALPPIAGVDASPVRRFIAAIVAAGGNLATFGRLIVEVVSITAASTADRMLSALSSKQQLQIPTPSRVA